MRFKNNNIYAIIHDSKKMGVSMRSMTGFGRGEVERDGRKLSIELKSVNHRYLDISLRLPRFLSFLERQMRAMLKKSLTRGHVDIYINYKNEREDTKTVKTDVSLAKEYFNSIDKIGEMLGIKSKVDASLIASFPDVLQVSDTPENEEEVTALLTEAMTLAIDQLVAMREAEGEMMQADLNNKLDKIQVNLKIVEDKSPQVVLDYRDRLRARISDLLDMVQIDENKMASEVAYFADKASIEEETVRMHSHIKQMKDTMILTESIGRKMDFIVQEMNREVNTICSKSNDLTITNTGLELKSEIEKLREMVQNVE